MPKGSFEENGYPGEMAAPPTVTFSVVCYGPARAGKMTCLRVLTEAFPPDEPRGKVQTDWYARDFRWHDVTPPKLGLIEGSLVRLCVMSYFCDGHDHPLCRRDVVLGANGVIFVADSSEDRQKANVTSWHELHDNLRRAGLDPATLPIVIYYNKRDVAGAVPIDTMNAAINPWGRHPWFEGSTRHGGAVVSALQGVSRGMLAAFREARHARPATPRRPSGWSPMFDVRARAPHERLTFARCAEIAPPGLRLLFVGDYAQEPDPRPLAQRAPVRVDAKSLSKVMGDLGLTLSLTVRDTLSGAPGATLDARLRFRRVSDFSPDAVVKQVPRLAQEIEVRSALVAIRGPMSGERKFRDKLAEVLTDPGSRERLLRELGPPGLSHGSAPLLEEVLASTHVTPQDEGYEVAARGVRAFLAGMVRHGRDAVQSSFVMELVREIDDRLSRQVDEILHHPRFLALEAAWRGLALLLRDLEPRASIRVDILPCSKADLIADFEDAPPGAPEAGLAAIVAHNDGMPYTAILADYQVSADPADLFLLKRCAAVAAAARAPFLAAAAPSLVGLSTYADLAGAHDLRARLQAASCRRLQAFRETEPARHAALLLPRFLARHRFGARAMPAEAFTYEEGQSDEPSTSCWGNPIYAFATRLAASFMERGACDDIAGLDRGGAVPSLRAQEIDRGGEAVAVGPLEGVISAELAEALTSGGLMSFVWAEDLGIACFPVAASLAKPRGA